MATNLIIAIANNHFQIFTMPTQERKKMNTMKKRNIHDAEVKKQRKEEDHHRQQQEDRQVGIFSCYFGFREYFLILFLFVVL
jgi:hypothetical protein